MSYDEFDFEDDFFDEFDDIDETPDLDLQPERDAFDRVAQGQTQIEVGDTLGNILKIADRMYDNPYDQFRIVVDAVARNLESRGVLDGIVRDLDKVLAPVNRIKNIEHINPAGYLVGYYTTIGGRKINTIRVNEVFSMLNHFSEYGMEKPDIIRYTRYWMQL